MRIYKCKRTNTWIGTYKGLTVEGSNMPEVANEIFRLTQQTVEV